MPDLDDFKVICDESNNNAETVAQNQLFVTITLPDVKQIRYDAQVASMLSRLRAKGLAIRVTRKAAYIFEKATGKIIV